jgi:hypothetical protein
MLGPPAVDNTAGQGENHAFSRKRHPADVRPIRCDNYDHCITQVPIEVLADEIPPLPEDKDFMELKPNEFFWNPTD